MSAETASLARRLRRGMSVGEFVERFALVGAWIAVVVVFSALKPDTFATWSNFAAILGSQAVLVVLTCALLIPLTAGDYDLSITGVLTLSQM
ncbi:MAG: ribose transport system permease protein, partial [Pseudonocardiales bacterium]|nr:ribose transport system permease protein [Pseudonocardiales bacterium]